MLLDCLHIGKNKKKSGRRSEGETTCDTTTTPKAPSNSIQPAMSAHDIPHPMTSPRANQAFIITGEESSLSFNSKDCKELEKKRQRSNTKNSISQICIATSSTTPMLFFSDGPPHRIQSWSESLDKLLQDPVGMQNFFIHLKNEHSTENICFWLACENYKASVSLDDQPAAEKAHQIFNEFLSKHAAHQVNLTCASLKDVQKGMAKPSTTTFEKAQLEIYDLMRTDCYPRFLKSERYLNLLENDLNNATCK